MSEDNVVRLGINTMVDHDPDDILERAKGEGFERVLVIGVYPDGRTYRASSQSDLATVNMDLDVFKAWIARECDRDGDR